MKDINQTREDLVSVIIPYYKKKKFIKKAINSVLEQSYKNLEIILIYDDQDLSDLNYIKYEFNLEKKIKYIVNKKTLGAGLSRNKGIDLALGEYLAFLDADDIWKKDKLNIQIKFMKNNNIYFSHTSYGILDNKNQIIGKRISRDFINVNDLLKSCDIGLSTVVISKKIIDSDTRFPNLKTKEDFVMWLQLLQKNVYFGSIDKILTLWRKTDNSLSSSILQKLLDAFRVYNIYMKFNIIKSTYYVFCLSINFLKKIK